MATVSRFLRLGRMTVHKAVYVDEANDPASLSGVYLPMPLIEQLAEDGQPPSRIKLSVEVAS